MPDVERIDEDERERQKAFDRLERASRGPSVVTADEERRLYELNRQGVDAPITPRPIGQLCSMWHKHTAHNWTTDEGGARYCRGIA